MARTPAVGLPGSGMPSASNVPDNVPPGTLAARPNVTANGYTFTIFQGKHQMPRLSTTTDLGVFHGACAHAFDDDDAEGDDD